MYEEQLIRKIKGKISGIKNKTITKEDAKVGVLLNALKSLNRGMYDELLNNYKAVTEADGK